MNSTEENDLENLYEQCQTCANKYSSMECVLCEDFDMYKEEKENKISDYAKKLLEKIDSGEKLTENELKTLVSEYEVKSEYGDNERWTRPVDTISTLGGRFFKTFWHEGLTEYQENEFYDQPVEVEKKEYNKEIHVVEWVTKEKQDR